MPSAGTSGRHSRWRWTEPALQPTQGLQGVLACVLHVNWLSLAAGSLLLGTCEDEFALLACKTLRKRVGLGGASYRVWLLHHGVLEAKRGPQKPRRPGVVQRMLLLRRKKISCVAELGLAGDCEEDDCLESMTCAGMEMEG